MRCRRRSTLLRCEPKTPRYACSSSITTYFRFWKSTAHFVWWGRMPECSMSGFVSTRFARAHGPPRILRRVAVVGEHPHLGQLLGELFQLGQLVLGERLRRKDVERARVGLVHDRLEHRQVVAERLARRRRRDDDDVASGLHELPRARVMTVELLDAAL